MLKSMEEIRLNAPAKINLSLDVLGRRSDGYHEVRMVMQTIDRYDRLWMRRTKEAGIRLTVETEPSLSGTDQGVVPTDETNLVCRAAKLLTDEFSIREGVWIRLRKVIPAAAGLAGGSSDAAAALVGMNRLFALGLTEEALEMRALSLGADVPFCIRQGTALAEGIGEKLTSLPALPPCRIVLVRPPVRVSTREVYTALRQKQVKTHPDIDGQIAALRSGDLSGVCALMENVLETVTVPAHPVIGQILEQMRAAGACGARMSGSGPTVFGIFDEEEKAAAACTALRERWGAAQVFWARPIPKAGPPTF